MVVTAVALAPDVNAAPATLVDHKLVRIVVANTAADAPVVELQVREIP